MGRRHPSPSQKGRDGEVRCVPNCCAVLRKVWPNRAFTSFARPRGGVVADFEEIQHSDVVFDALSTRGRREEWGKCHAMHGLCVLREVSEIPPYLIAVVSLENPEMILGLGFSPEKATNLAVMTRSRQADPSRQGHMVTDDRQDYEWQPWFDGAYSGIPLKLGPPVGSYVRDYETESFGDQLLRWCACRILNTTAVGVVFWLPLLWVDVCMCVACRTLGWPTDVGKGKAMP
ncbi:hypothetical protein Taro_047365 [Colocasia esculenta]|uniref:Uncharacterized protein n=1 Tax=Colocasia esculenta TaxID=4460 RepID=A0A843X724_COLES|nr:hypothetical protein [Colocasia esculenta]